MNEHKKKYPVVCAWCGRACGVSQCEHSHGICPECAKAVLKEYISACTERPLPQKTTPLFSGAVQTGQLFEFFE